MERKSNVADQEVNDLTNRNEDLTQQSQSLQDQLEESERRREKEREDFSREKEQWLQMLEQGRRITARKDDEKRALSQRISDMQAESELMQGDRNDMTPTSLADSKDLRRLSSQDSNSGKAFPIPSSAGLVGDDDAINVATLKAKIEFLRFALEDSRRLNQGLEDRAHEVLSRSLGMKQVIGQALDEGNPDIMRREPQR